MNIKERVVELLADKKYKKMTVDEIFNFLHLEPLEFKELVKTINELENEGVAYIQKNGDIRNAEDLDIYLGKVTNMDTYTLTVTLNNGRRVYVNRNQSKFAYLNDDVRISIYNRNNADIIKIIKRNTWKILAFYNGKKMILDDQYCPFKVKMMEQINLKPHDLVILEILKYDGAYINCKVDKILGKTNDPGIEILKEIIKSNVPYEFSNEVIDATVESVKEYEKNYKNEIKTRLNLTNELTVTIDGDDTKDIDDAISLTMLDNGNFKLGVHIADVSYFVKENTLLDTETLKRGTSIYLADRVIPMLPPLLSNDVCSLNPNENRLAMSCIMEVDYEGNVVNYLIKPSFIRSNARLTYNEVNALFKHEENSISKEVASMLFQMRILSSVLSKKMLRRGYLELGIDEAKLILDDNKKVSSIEKRIQDEAEKLIENFMILANETVATHVYNKGLPFIYRVHDKPIEEKFAALKENFDSLNIPLPEKEVDCFYLQKLLTKYHNTELEDVLSNIILRFMSKAIYSVNNIGHYGLGSKCYTHFTSPIRRYPDLMVHRLLKLYDNNINNVDLTYLLYVADSTSMSERRALMLERNVEDIKKAEYMEQFIGEIYEGTITGVKDYGIFVALDNTCEGLMPYETMGEYGYFDYSRSLNSKFRLGMRVTVRLISCTVEKGEINFAYVGKSHYNKRRKGK